MWPFALLFDGFRPIAFHESARLVEDDFRSGFWFTGISRRAFTGPVDALEVLIEGADVLGSVSVAFTCAVIDESAGMSFCHLIFHSLIRQ